MKKLLVYFGSNYKLGYFGGSFQYILGLFKTKVQNGNVFGGSQNFKFFFCFFFFWGGGGLCLIFLFWGGGRGGVNSRCMEKN